MKKPKSLMIGCDKWEVKYVKQVVADGDECHGYCDTNERRILIKDSLQGTRFLETLLHEILHAINGVYNIKETEDGVNLMGVQLLDTLRRNKIDLLA